MNDSTASLIGSDAPYIKCFSHTFPAGQRDMHEDNPIPCHAELKLCLVAPRRNLFRIRKHRSHAGMRHISLQRDMGSDYWLRGGIGQIQSNGSRANPNGLRGDFVRNHDTE
jgi:hypothetical protein